jgi:hypothetical protein
LRRHIFAVCDLEEAYACNFMEYLNQKKNIPFEIHAFTSAEHLLEFAGTCPIEILLISDKAMCPEIQELHVGQLIILSEGVHHPDLDQYPSVYKYQSSDAVIREVMSCYGEEQRNHEPLTSWKRSMDIIGIYSPLGRVLKTSFALTLGQLIARDKAVLYINLEEYSGFEYWMGQSYERNLSDLIYYIRQSNSNLIHKINGMVQTINNMDYLPPALSFADVRGVTFEEWSQLLEILYLQSSYEVVILDLGDGVDELFALLDRCTRIYMPVRQDKLSQGKIAQFENLLRLWDCVPVLEKIEKLRLPYHNASGDGAEYVDQLIWSELGDFTRGLLRKGGK